jgi:O-antigen/teichoic acid export membrane protein
MSTQPLGQAARVVEIMRPTALGSLPTSGERARERHRRIALSAVAALLARATAVVVNLVAIPIALGSLGPERYGVWVTLSSFVLMLAFADLGIGSAVLNLVSEADGRDDRAAMRRYVSSAFVVMLAVAGVLVLALAVVYPIVDWTTLLHTANVPSAEASLTLVITFVLFAVGIPLALAQRAQLAFQEGFAVSLWQAAGSVAGLVGLVALIRLGWGLPGVALALGGGIVLGAAGNFVAFFHRRPWLRPSREAVSAVTARLVLRRGVLFFVLQIAAGLAFASDNVVADQVLGPEAAARYSVAQRLFFLPPVVIALATTPLWPAYSEALARGDRAWVRATFLRSVAASMALAALGGALLTIFREPIFSLWVGPDLVPSFSLSVALALWAVLYSWGAAVVVLLNAANVIALQVVAALSMGVASLVLKTYLASIAGIDGIVWGVIAAYTLLTFVPYTIYFLRWSPLRGDLAEARA